MKIALGKLPYVYPIPITLVGADVHGRPNFAEIGDLGLMGINPALVVISSHRDHYTNLGILENGTFSINFPTTSMLAKTDSCGVVSGREVDKSALFETFYGETGTAPLITECPVGLECRVVQEFTVQHRQMFIGEVVQCYASEEFVNEQDGRMVLADLTRLDPILYALDNRYYSIGPPIGIGYLEAKKTKGEEL
ncbi:MAG: flavin reductase family protein [Anaerolineales bacterium]|nr:flavin reductase family protein [Anaerolineales bacterium]